MEPSRKNEIGAESPTPANPAADKAETKADQPNLIVVQYQNLPPAAYAQEQARRPAARSIAEVHLSPPAVSAPTISPDQPANQVHAGDNEKIVAAIEREVARIEKTTPLTQDQKDRLRRGLSKKLAKRLARSATLERALPSPAQTGSTAAAEGLFQEMKRESAWPENSVEEFSMLASETEAEVKRILSESLEASASLEFLGVESASLFQRVREAHHRFLRKR